MIDRDARTTPLFLYHMTTQNKWRSIQECGVMNRGKGEGWTECEGIFTNGSITEFGFFEFLMLKMEGRNDSMVVVAVKMTPELVDMTRVRLLASSKTDTGKILLEKAKSGCFGEIKDESQIVLHKMRGRVIVRNTFPLQEFVDEIPESDDPVEYIIGCDQIALDLLSKVAEVKRQEIPVNIARSAKLLARRLKYRHEQAQDPQYTARTVKRVATDEDWDILKQRLLSSVQEMAG